MGAALHYHVGEVPNTNAQVLIRMLERTTAENRAVLERVALNYMEYAPKNKQLNVMAVNQTTVELQNELKKHMNVMGQVNACNAQHIRNIVQIVRQNINIRQQSVQHMLQQIIQHNLRQQVVVHHYGNRGQREARAKARLTTKAKA